MTSFFTRTPMPSDSTAPKNTSLDLCGRCSVALVPGKAFVQPVGPVLDIATDFDFSIALVDCLKCPKCGHSELANDHQFANAVGSELRAMSSEALAHFQVFGREGLRWDCGTRQYVVDEKPAHPPSLK